MRKLFHQHETLDHLLDVSFTNVRRLLEQHMTDRAAVMYLLNMLAHGAVRQGDASRARDWVLGVLTCHFRLRMRSRQHDLSLFGTAIEKEMTGGRKTWSAKERFYMTLTDPELSDTVERLQATYVVVLHANLVHEVRGVAQHTNHRIERFRRAEVMDAEMIDAHESIVQKALSAKVDHFACAVPLSVIRHSTAGTDHEGACPICQNSYTSTEFPVEDMLADYPVRIKYCGHIVGKSCLERWMITPKIDEAKYPFRTCPLCRTPIEGECPPHLPTELRKHLSTSRVAVETLFDIEGLADMNVDDCLNAVLACMSDEIAAEELMKEAGNGSLVGETDLEGLKETIGTVIENCKKEKWAWGFRGEGAWKNLRDEWAQSGVVREQ
jgi:hypothetical protein